MHTTTLKGVVLVRPLIRITTGTVAVDRDTDLDAVKGGLPPTSIVSDGRKRILNSARLAPLFNCRKAVERALTKIGAPFLGATMVPETKLAALEAEIRDIEVQFYAYLDDLAANLEGAYLEWEEDNPAWSSLISRNRLPAHELKSRCRFVVAYFRAEAPANDVGGRFKAAVSEAVPALLADIATEACKVHDAHIMGRDTCTHKAVTPISKLIDKLVSFSMLDPRVAPSAAGFRSVLAALPRTGTLKGGDFATLAGLIAQLRTPEEMLEHGEQLFANRSKPAQASLLGDPDGLEIVNEDTEPTVQAMEEVAPPTTPRGSELAVQADEEDARPAIQVLLAQPMLPPRPIAAPSPVRWGGLI
ncbi:DUF3150 domain-containing protein [Aquimonas sp.]|jgi:hypothetical protein|uniref:DUF3150 domain-containing protein n=1 Tax=Aquimonas sp. TaxID=1872588 RepID=UPI0037C18AAD